MDHPFREPGSIDQSEIEKTKIYQAEETKRKLIEEKEETIRRKCEIRGPDFYMGVILASIVIVGALVIGGGLSYNNYLDKRYPITQCIESVEVISSADRAKHCPNGHVEIENIPGMISDKIIAKCKCSP
jgi:hypothetical protein